MQSFIRSVAREPLALVIAAMVLWRPWRDGITYPIWNTYFLWAILALFTVWAAEVLLRDRPFRHGNAIALLGGFLVVAAFSLVNTVEVNGTYRALLVWTGHFCLFVVAANVLRSRAAFGIVLGVFLVVSFAQAVVGLWHLRYVLPFVRQQMTGSSTLLREYFGQDTLSAEIADRLTVNRAFGYWLFPNALAAFLVLGIPFLLAQIPLSVAKFRAALRTAQTSRARGSASGLLSALVGVLAYFAVMAPGFLHLALSTELESGWKPGAPASPSVPSIVFVVGILPGLIAGILAYVTYFRGITVSLAAVRAAFMPLAVVASTLCLWKTYSRGSMLALSAACVFAAFLLWLGGRTSRASRVWSKAASTAVVITLALALLLTFVNHTGSAAEEPKAAVQSDAPAASPTPQIRVQGKDVTLRDLADPNTMLLRLAYWRVGWLMIKDNVWGGVGLGNFATVYSKYKFPGAPDVREAHNDFLQMWCETGLFGFLLFAAFWGYFIWKGARRIVRETNREERFLLLGLYTGVLAFLGHAVVDFDFYNPALGFFQFVLAGAFLARANGDEIPARKPILHQSAAVVLLMLAALTLAASLRPHRADKLIGAKNLVDLRLMVGARLLSALNEERSPQHPVMVPYRELQTLVPGRKTIESFAAIQAPVRSNPPAYVAVAANVPVPLEAIARIKDTRLAREKVKTGINAWLDVLKRADALYPYNPDTAGQLFQWYDLLLGQADDEKQRQELTLEVLAWAERAVKRSPEHAWYRLSYGKALWYRGNIERGAKSLDFYSQGLEQYRLATTLYATAPEVWLQYGNALIEYGNVAKRLGRGAQSQSYIEQGQKILAEYRPKINA